MKAFREITLAFGEDSERRGLTEEQLMAELEETKKEVYQEMYGKD